MCIMSNHKQVCILYDSRYIQLDGFLQSGVSGSAVTQEIDKGQTNREKTAEREIARSATANICGDRNVQMFYLKPLAYVLIFSLTIPSLFYKFTNSW